MKYIKYYENTPDDVIKNLKKYIIWELPKKGDIIYFSSNKEDCEIFLSANKYNL